MITIIMKIIEFIELDVEIRSGWKKVGFQT